MNDVLSSVLNVDRLDAVRKPFPHALVDEFFNPVLFRQLHEEFPNIQEMDRPKAWGQNLCWGDEEYERHLERSPAWKKAFEGVQSQAFLDFIIDQFGDLWESEGCTIDLSKARYVPYIEDRVDKELSHLRKVVHEPHELWCRLDIYQSSAGYYRPAHLDHRRRLISMLVYFDDQEEIQMVGGELLLHPPGLDLDLLRQLGVHHAPKAFSMVRDKLARTVKISPQANRMAMFLCGKNSWHAVPAVRSSRAPRQHAHIVISSSVDAWQ